MMSSEGAPATSNLDGKRKMREIGVVEERVHEESSISIREQILSQKGEVER
ncbi:unnamed protein product [Pocillopora meandrina]|uniref:Uncharacterized protein n=1 Tax=Pocillopora meandrina TaxID=46732 RepID=A0AAU9X975_9CNID|nr:unnamed protein product [Pocillopora meandrina]